MKTFLSNPFIRLAGWNALAAGIAGIIVSGLLAWWSGMQFDGMLDIHFSTFDPGWQFNLVAGLLNWVSLVIVFGIFSHLFSSTRFRWLDVLGTQAFARIPLLFAFVVSFLIDMQELVAKAQYLLQYRQIPAFSASEVLGFILMSVILLLIMIWLIAWTWKAYVHTAHIKGNKAVLSFIGGLLLAEILSKVLLSVFLDLPLLPDLSTLTS